MPGKGQQNKITDSNSKTAN